MHDKLDALQAFFDPASVAAALSDALKAQAGPINGVPAPAGAATANDQELLRQLLPSEVYGFWREAGYLGMYCMTFMLRHAVTFLALAAHEAACAGAPREFSGRIRSCIGRYFSDLEEFDVTGCMSVLFADMPLQASGGGPAQPVFGFSSLGVHLLMRRAGACRAFDHYSIGDCAEQAAPLFCRRHAAEAWWVRDEAGATTQAGMFGFYAPSENLYRYGEQELEELVGRFWHRMRHDPRMHIPDERAAADALCFFGYASLQECSACGRVELRKRYAGLARQLHPDTGGRHESFVMLRKHYDTLRVFLQYESACFPDD